MSTSNIQELVTVIDTATQPLDKAPMDGVEAALGQIDPSEVQTELGLIMDRMRAIVGELPGVSQLAKEAYVGAMTTDHAYYDMFKGSRANNTTVDELLGTANVAHLKSADALHETDLMAKKFGEAFAMLVGVTTLVTEGTEAYERAVHANETAQASKITTLDSVTAYTKGITG